MSSRLPQKLIIFWRFFLINGHWQGKNIRKEVAGSGRKERTEVMGKRKEDKDKERRI